MIDSVNFCGFKNAGIQVAKLIDENKKLRATVTLLNTELTNDLVGADLEIFTPILKKYPHANNKNFLDFELCTYHMGKSGGNLDTFVLNDKNCAMNAENLGLFEKVAKLLRKISDTPEDTFKLSKDYIEGPDCVENFYLNIEEDNIADLAAMHEPGNVKKIAQILLERLTDAVSDFLS